MHQAPSVADGACVVEPGVMRPGTIRGAMKLLVLVTYVVVAGALGLLAAVAGCEPAPDGGMAGPADRGQDPYRTALEDEVVANILAQPVGRHTLADFDLPEPFVRRTAARIVRESYRRRFHVVYTDAAATATAELDTDPEPGAGGSSGREREFIAVVRHAMPDSARRAWESMLEERPPRRGLVAPILDREIVRGTSGRGEDAAALEGTRDVVARRLARDGLLATLVHVVASMDPGARAAPAAAIVEHLRAAGFPVDLLRHFTVSVAAAAAAGGDAGARDPAAHVRRIVEGLAAGEDAAALAVLLAATPFDYQPTRAGFRAADESGEHDLAMLRVQVTRGTYWNRPGAGGGLDVVRQLVRALPDVAFTVAIEERFLEPFLAAASGWGPRREGAGLSVLSQPLIVSQWAQDNGKSGFVDAPGPGARRHATIVPRYASRRNDGSVFVPGESLAASALAASGHAVVHSPLLFQGGNLLAVRDPATGARLLLVGEAEIHRNTALGLTDEQVARAFAREFGVERCIVLPSVSFHIDYDVSVRAHGGRLVAFVNDADAAIRLVIEAGIAALVRGGVVPPGEARSARGLLESGRPLALSRLLGERLHRLTNAGGEYPLSLAELFAAGPSDSPVGNLHRFLAALDAAASGDRERPEHEQTRAYFDAHRRTAADRRRLHAVLSDQGWRVVPIPGFAEGDRSLIYVNGIHDRGRYLMPAYGGLFAAVDEAAGRAFAAALGPDIRIVPILCGESQRRSGAVHCSASAYPSDGSPAGSKLDE